MSDKLSSGVSINITFTEGEVVSPAKLNAISAQLRRVAEHLETSVGDVHSQSWPYLPNSTTTLSQAWGKNKTTGNSISGSAERDLDIASLARLMGPASNLNPRMITGVQAIEEDTPVGVHEFPLRYVVHGAVSTVITTDTSMTNRVDPTDMAAAGDWSVTTEGKVRSVSATTGGTISYSTDSSEWGGGTNYPGARFNVIPDPNQVANGASLTIGALDGAGRRSITLPMITHQASDIDGLTMELDAKDVNYNRQLRVPKVLADNLTAGDEIPLGFMFLKNETTNQVYEDAELYYDTISTVLVANVDLVSALAAGHDFSLITVGTDITTSIDDLRNKTYHSHDRSYGEPFVAVDGIIGQYEEAGNSGVFGPSEIPGNSFSQYLHRDGYNGSVDAGINDHNAMRGDLLMGVAAGAPGSYVGSGASFKVRFGNSSSNDPYIRKDSSDDLVVFNGGGDVRIQSNSNTAQQFVSDPVVRVKSGIIGDVTGAIGDPGVATNGLAPYGATGSLTISGSLYDVISLPADIKAKTWYSVSLAFKAVATTLEGSTAAWLYSPDFTGYEYSWEVDDTTKDIVVPNLGSGTNWNTSDVVDYRIVIWYQS